MSKSVLVLRACNADMSSKNGFIWPTSGPVECSDWEPTDECGNGLHGWLHGHGDGNVSNYTADDCKWLVVKVKNKYIIDLADKVKFKKGTVVFCGDRKGATDYLITNDPIASTKPVIGSEIHTLKRYSQAIGTDFSNVSVKDNSLAVSRYRGVSNGEEFSVCISGKYGKAISGVDSLSYTDDNGESISRRYGVSISGYNGKSFSGDCGIAISSYFGTSKCGDVGISVSREGGSVSAGQGGIIIQYRETSRWHFAIGRIGEGGLEPNVAYTLDKHYNFVKVSDKIDTCEPLCDDSST